MSCQYVGYALGCHRARCSAHVCEGLFLIQGIYHPCGKGASCDSLLIDGMREMTRNVLGFTQENKPCVPQLGKEHSFPWQVHCVNRTMVHLASQESSFAHRQPK